jgi:hypothetical protein
MNKRALDVDDSLRIRALLFSAPEMAAEVMAAQISAQEYAAKLK